MEPAIIGAGIGAGARLFPSIASGIKSGFKAIGRPFNYLRSGKRYDKKMVELYGTMRVFGQTEPRPLDDIFTDVHILPKPTLMRRFSLESLHKQFLEAPRNLPLRYDERVAADELLETTDKLFILGKPGAGKTTFCKHLAVREAKGTGRINKVPIFVTLKQYADTGKTLIEFINEQFDVCDFPDAAPFVEALLRDGKALVLFDGLDEVTKDDDGRNRVATEINQFSRKYSGCHIVVTCRVAATDYSFEQFRYVEMAEFAPEQVETFVRQWFLGMEENVGKADKMLAELEQHEGISDLTRNPLLLTLLCLNYDETMAFPTRRVEIYQDALDALMKKWDSSRGIKRGSAYGSLSLGRKQEMLAELAYNTYREGRYVFERREIEPQLAEYVAGAPEVPERIDIDGEVILQEIVAQHGLLAYRATDILSFSHRTFHEYFTAMQIVENRDADTFAELFKHTADDSWREVFLLTASLLHKAAVGNFFRQFVQVLHKALRQRPNTIRWLSQVAAATEKLDSSYQPAAIRRYFIQVKASNPRLSISLQAPHDLDHTVRGLDLELTLDNSLARSLTLALDLASFNPADQQPDFVRILDLARIGFYKLAVNPEDADNLKVFFTLNFADGLIKISNFARSLGYMVLADALENLDAPMTDASQQAWTAFAESLGAVINVHRPLNNLSALQVKAREFANKSARDTLVDSDLEGLIAFVEGSNRLYECLQVAYLSPAERAAFEAQLLLPPPS